MEIEEQSDTEVIRIWPEHRERTRTMHSEQLQLGTNRGTSTTITAQTKEEAICPAINTHNPRSAVCREYSTTSHAEMKIEEQHRSHRHNRNKDSALPFILIGLSLEKMVLFQTDIIWENYIAAAYKTNDSDGRIANADIYRVDSKKLPTFVLNQKERQFHASSYRSVAAKSSCRPGSKQSRQAMMVLMDCEIAVKMDNQRPFKRKLLASLIGDEEVRAKQASYSFSKSCDTRGLSIQVSGRKSFSRSKMLYSCFKNSDKFDQTTVTGSTDLCNVAKKYPDKQSYLEETRSSLRKVNTPKICSCTRDGYEICSVKCGLESMLKDSILGEIDVFTSICIPQTDSMVDCTVPYSSFMQNGHCKAQVDSEESNFLKTSTDSSINPHVSFSLYPQMTSNVILNNGDDKSIKSQCQLFYQWVSHEKSAISANMLKNSPLLEKTDAPFIDKKNCHSGSKLLSSAETSFPAWLSHHGKVKNQSFLPNISCLILAGPLFGMPIKDFAYSQSSISQVESLLQNALQILQPSPKPNGIKTEEAEVEVTFGKETMNESKESALLDYKTALKNQAFCFPSHFLDAVENSEADIPEKFTQASWMQSGPKQVFDETYENNCLIMSMVELQSDSPTEANSFLHSEKLLYKNQAEPDSNAAMESEFRSCRKECHGAATLHPNEVNVPGVEHKIGKAELQDVTANKEIVGNFFQESMIHDTYLCENIIQNGRGEKRLDIISKNNSENEEHNETLKLNASNESINLKKLSLSTSIANGILSETILNAVTKEEHELQVEGAFSLANTENPNCNLSGADYSLDGNTAIDVTSLSTKEPGGVTLHVFGMKAQFDLVLEELKLFHSIGQSNDRASIADDKKGIEDTLCSNLADLPDILTDDLPCDAGMDGDDCGFNNKTLTEEKEQKVPQASWPATAGDEESLYSPVKGGNTAKTFSWPSSFMTYGERTITQHTGKEVTFSHGIGRVTPLKTRSGPLRIGLSKKAKIKQLHPYLRY